MSACTRSTCFAPEITCEMGCLDHNSCREWNGESEVTVSQENSIAEELVLPWSGSASGLVDMAFIAGRTKPLVVGIVGAQNAGKTTLLAAWYLLMGRGLIGTDKWQFAGSYTLAGWEAIAASLRWGPGYSPNFPSHTTSRGGRAPGLLHFAFRNANTKLREFMFADAPGEWFQKWAINRDAIDGGGARWVAEHSDVFLLIADREALSGPKMGSARGSLQVLARRVAAERGARPVALVWTKSDVTVDPGMENAIRDAVFNSIPDAAEFSISIESDPKDTLGKGQGLLELFDWILEIRRERVLLPPLNVTSLDPLFMFGVR